MKAENKLGDPRRDLSQDCQPGLNPTLSRPDAGERLIVIGAGEHAKVVISAIESLKNTVARVLDHNPVRTVADLFGYPVETYTDSTLAALVGNGDGAIIAIGDNEARRRIARALSRAAWRPVFHASAIVDRRAAIGEGTLLSAGTVINPDAVIGRHVIINTAAVVEHDVVIGDFCHVAPNVTLCGNVTIGEGTLVGAGSVVLPGRSVGAGCQVGAGAVVTRDLPDGTTATGVPARRRAH